MSVEALFSVSAGTQLAREATWDKPGDVKEGLLGRRGAAEGQHAAQRMGVMCLDLTKRQGCVLVRGLGCQGCLILRND